MKRAQVQVQETILVLFIFIIILVIGLIFFYRYNAQSLENDVFDAKLAEFDSMLSTFQQMPEVRCSFLGEDLSCVDSFKVLGFQDAVNKEKGFYRAKFGFKNITIYEIYPEKGKKACDFSSIYDCGMWNIYLEKPRNYKQVLIRKTPISLYFPDKDEYGIGELVIEWYL